MNLIFQQRAGVPVTQVMLVFPRSGACLDPPGQRGIGRLLLRLMMAGADGLDNAEFNGRLERLGASLGYSLSNDHLRLRLFTLTESLDAALDLLMAALHHPNLDAAEFARLQQDSLSAWQADREESKVVRAQEVYLGRLYQDQPQGYQPDGTLQGLRALSLDTVRQHYTRLLGRADPLLAVLSDLSRERVERQVLPRLTAPPLAEGLPYPWDGFRPSPPQGLQACIVADAETQTDEVLLGGFTVPETVPDWHIHKLIALVLGGDMNSRLFRVVRGEHGYSYGASCWYESSHGHCPRNQVSPFSLYTFPTVEHTAQAVPLLLSLYRQFCEQGVTAEELRRGQESLINSFPFTRDTAQKRLALEVEHTLYGITLDDEASFQDKVLAITAADVQRVLRQTHPAQAQHLVLLGDPERLKPVAQALPGLQHLDVVHYP